MCLCAGYGACEGIPSEDSINAAADAVLSFVQVHLRWPLDRIILFGQSIGTGPMCYLAAKLNSQGLHFGGLILQSPYTSLKDAVKFLAGTVASHLVNTGWKNIEEVKKIVDPILLIHGVKDEIIPTFHSEQLFEACVSQKKHLLVVNQATHNQFDHHLDVIAPISHFLTCYLRTPAKPNSQPAGSPIKVARQAAQEIKDDADASNAAKMVAAAEAAAAAPADATASSSSSSSSAVAPVSAASAVSSSSAATASPVDVRSSDPSPPPIAPHNPPSSPMPPPTLKIERKYFSVPAMVVAAHHHRMEQMRLESDARARAFDRKAAVKGFFSGLGYKLSNAARAVTGKPAIIDPTDEKAQAADMQLRLSNEARAGAGAGAGAGSHRSPDRHRSSRPATAQPSSSSPGVRNQSLPPPSPQRSHSPAAGAGVGGRSRIADPLASPSSGSGQGPDASPRLSEEEELAAQIAAIEAACQKAERSGQQQQRSPPRVEHASSNSAKKNNRPSSTAVPLPVAAPVPRPAAAAAPPSQSPAAASPASSTQLSSRIPSSSEQSAGPGPFTLGEFADDAEEEEEQNVQDL